MLSLIEQFTAIHNLAASNQAMASYFILVDSGVEVDGDFVSDMFMAATLMGGEI